MGRPNLTKVRTAEILDAFERCVGKYGLEGSSLERVAEEAQMKRSILRHYIGNREELIHALAERVVEKYRSYFAHYRDHVSDKNRIKQLLEFFFPDRPIDSAENVMVVEALIAAGERYPRVRQMMLDYIDELVEQTAVELRLVYGQTPKLQCWNVAYGVVSICFNQDSLSALGLPPKFLKAARSCSAMLIQTLQR